MSGLEELEVKIEARINTIESYKPLIDRHELESLKWILSELRKIKKDHEKDMTYPEFLKRFDLKVVPKNTIAERCAEAFPKKYREAR